MKFRVIFLKKKNLYYALLIVILLILFSILLYIKKSSPTFNVISQDKTIKTDLTGDGEEDILYIKVDKEKYFLQVNSNGESIFLEPNKKLDSMGTFSKHWPMRLSLFDISRDKVPEIFIQSSNKDVPIQHIFKWDNTKKKFEDILFNQNNILGIMDSCNSKTPKVISGTLKDNQMSLKNYIILRNKFEEFDYKYSNDFMGKNSIITFINYIQGLPTSEANRPQEIFDTNISGKDLQEIGKLSAENIQFKFQDATFLDKKYNKNGDASIVQWTLNFKGTSNKDTSIVKNYTIIASLKLYEDPAKANVEKNKNDKNNNNASQNTNSCFKIYSIDLR